MKFHIRQVVEPDDPLDSAAIIGRMTEWATYERGKIGAGVVPDNARPILKEAADLVAKAIGMKEDKE